MLNLYIVIWFKLESINCPTTSKNDACFWKSHKCLKNNHLSSLISILLFLFQFFVKKVLWRHWLHDEEKKIVWFFLCGQWKVSTSSTIGSFDSFQILLLKKKKLRKNWLFFEISLPTCPLLFKLKSNLLWKFFGRNEKVCGFESRPFDYFWWNETHTGTCLCLFYLKVCLLRSSQNPNKFDFIIVQHLYYYKSFRKPKDYNYWQTESFSFSLTTKIES